MPSNLVLITTAYPSSSVTEEVFVSPELEALSREFDRVIIVPLHRYGAASEVKGPGIIIDWSIADSLSSRCKIFKLPALCSSYVRSNYARLLKSNNNLSQFISQSFYCMNVEICRRKLKRIISKYGLDTKSTVFYTFWFDYQAISLYELSKEMPLTFVSRAHGYDIFDHAAPNRPSYLRALAMTGIKALYPASREGERYLKDRYPGNDHKIHTRILGSDKDNPDYKAKCHDEESGMITFLSVARVSPEKGVTRNLEFVIQYAKVHKDKTVKWIHIGDGPEMNTLSQSCGKEAIPVNLEIELRGSLHNSAVHTIYHTEPIDWVMLFSDYEGGCPIAVSEAISYAVPVIGNAVGGIPEIITPDCGITVAHGTPPAEIVKKIDEVMSDRNAYLSMRETAHNRWKEKFSAGKLRAEFASELTDLIK